MASSGSFKTSGYNGLYLNFSWSAVEQSTDENYTKIYWELKGTGSHNYYAGNFKVKILEDTVYSSSDRILLSDGVLVASGYKLIWHDNYGDRNFNAYVEAGIYTYAVNCSGSGSWDLNRISRASVINSFNGHDIEGNFSVIYTSYSSSFTHRLYIAIANTTTLQSFDNYVSGSYVYLSNEALSRLYPYMATSPTVELSAWVETWNGNTKIGQSKEIFNTCSVDNASPRIEASVEDENDKTIALTGNKKTLVKFYSNARATMTAEAYKGAAIDESLYIIRNGDNTGYDTTYTFYNVESNRFTFSAEDSRGGIGKATVTLDMVEYIKLTCNIANNRPDALGNINIVCTGEYFNDTFGAVENTLQVQWRYSISGGAFSDWADMSVTITGDSYSAYKDFDIPNFSQTQSYVFETRAIDKLDEVSSNSGAVKSIPIFHWGENDFVFEVPVTFNAGVTGATSTTDTGNTESDTYNGSKTITGNLRLKGTGNYGNHLLFGDSNFCYIAELTDDVMTIHANKIYLDASSGVYVDDYAIPILDKGIWTPALNSSAISSYTTRYGWYSKMGQTVTVGFFIKANCNSGYTSTAISISGLPFTPMYSAAGGGMCSGAYVSAGFNFQCFVAETSGNITMRVQSCNHTSQTNLSTSASGCWYRSGGGEITLSGTITFIANS